MKYLGSFLPLLSSRFLQGPDLEPQPSFRQQEEAGKEMWSSLSKGTPSLEHIFRVLMTTSAIRERRKVIGPRALAPEVNVFLCK